MRKATPVCVQCGGDLEEGFLRDATYGGSVPSTWVEGEPERSFWTGTKLSGKVQYQVQAYRCVKCGRIELYGHEPPR
jgi:hypothetical protein